MSKNEFLLPDELGWECNDELNALVKAKIKKLYETTKDDVEGVRDAMIIDVFIGELLDDIYAVIKKYQEKAEEEE